MVFILCFAKYIEKELIVCAVAGRYWKQGLSEISLDYYDIISLYSEVY